MFVYKKQETDIDLRDFLNEVLNNYAPSRQERLNPRTFVTYNLYDLISDCRKTLRFYGYDIVSEDSVQNELFTNFILEYIKNYFNDVKTS